MNICSYFINAIYPSYILSFSNLIPISFYNLTFETQHCNYIFIVRAFNELNNITSIQNAIENKFDNIKRLAIYNLLSTTATNIIFPLDTVVTIKKPYYKRIADSGLFIQIDHLTDFIPFKPDNNIISSNLTARTTKISLSAFRLKEDGNATFKKNDFQMAVNFYSDALKAFN